MEQMYDSKMKELGYNQLVCDIFANWEDVKDEILPPDRKQGTGNGTVHVFLGAADSELRKEFPAYYENVSNGEDTAVGAVKVKHYFLATNVLSMLGYICRYYFEKNTDFNDIAKSILRQMEDEVDESGLLTTESFFKLSIGSARLRPYFKQFDEKGVFHKIIRLLLLPDSSYKISLFKNEEGEYAALWLIGFNYLSNFEADSNDKYTKKEDRQAELPLQQIFYGAPGTGKSNTIKCEVDQNDLARVRTTFHPDSDYSTFVGAYKPTSVEVPVMTIIGKEQVPVENAKPEKKIVYEFVPQAFLKAYTGAWKNQSDPFFLIIEEINRGNCAQIFGDLFQLLDRNDETGLSDYPISPDEDIQKFLLTDKKYGFAALTEEQKAAIPAEVLSGELMILPKNLHIWATMNTSDQSLFPIDSAFKRRWDWQYMPISDGKKGWQIAANGKRYDWWQFLQKMNDQIGSTTNSEDKKLGYFFCKAKNGVIDAETFVGKVVFYIWNDVFKDFAEEAGDLFKDVEGTLSFNKFYTVAIDGKAKVVEEKVELLLQNLGVEPIDDVEYVEENDLDDNPTDESRSSNNRLHVTFPDGETIRIQTSKEYVDVLKKIGLDKAYDVAQSKDPSILKCAFVTKEKEEAIENSAYLRYETIGEYHVVRGMSGDTMRPFLEKISNRYSLGLKFYRQ